jgi:hypothetical protein
MIDDSSHVEFSAATLPSFLPLGATAQDELWPPEQSASILLYSSTFLPNLSLSVYGEYHIHPLVSEQFRFYGVRLLASRPTPNLDSYHLTCPACVTLPVATVPSA